MAGRSGAPADAVSEERCPLDGRVGTCAIRQLNGLNYYYGTGEHAKTAEEARASCEEMRGTWIE